MRSRISRASSEIEMPVVVFISIVYTTLARFVYLKREYKGETVFPSPLKQGVPYGEMMDNLKATRVYASQRSWLD